MSVSIGTDVRNHHPTALLMAALLLASCSSDRYLMESAAQADCAGVNIALKRGADPNTALEPGETALGLLLNQYKQSDEARRGCIEQNVVALLHAGADANALHHGYTPLQTAAGLGSENIVTSLLAHGADPSLETRAGLAPIWQCVYANDFRISLQLLTAGANPNATDTTGQTPLQYLRARGYTRTPLMLQLRRYGGH